MVDVVHGTAQHQFEVGLAFQPLHHAAGQGTKVHVRTVLDPGRRHPLHRIPVPDHQGHPLFQLLRRFGVLHFLEQVVRPQLLIAPLQERHVLLAPNKALVRGSVDEVFGLGQDSLLYQVGPELKGHFELGVDLEGPFDGHVAILGFRSVVQFAVAGMAGPRVVPSVGAFMGNVVESLHHDDVQGRIQLLEHHAEGGAHDATADQHYVCLSNGHWFLP